MQFKKLVDNLIKHFSDIFSRFNDFCKNKPIYLYLGLSILVFVCVPPLRGIDESNHIIRAWQISEGKGFEYHFSKARTNWVYLDGSKHPAVFDQLNPIVDTIGTLAPQELVTAIDNYNVKYRVNYTSTESFLQRLKLVYQKLNTSFYKSNLVFSPIPNTIIYAPTAYLHFLPVFWIAKLFGLNFFPMYYFLKIANFLITLPLIIWFFRENKKDQTPLFNIFIINYLIILTNTGVNIDGLLLTSATILVINFIKSYFGVGEKMRLLNINLLLLGLIILIKPIFLSLAILYLPHIRLLPKLSKKAWIFFIGILFLAGGQYLIYLNRVGEIFPYRTPLNNNIAENKAFYLANWHWLKQLPKFVWINLQAMDNYFTNIVAIKSNITIGILMIFTTILSTILIIKRLGRPKVKFMRSALILAYLTNLFLISYFVDITWLGVRDYNNSELIKINVLVRYIYFLIPGLFIAVFYNKRINKMLYFPKFYKLLKNINNFQLYFLFIIMASVIISLQTLW